MTCLESFQTAAGHDGRFGVVALDGMGELSEKLRSTIGESAACFPLTNIDDVTRCIDQLWLIMHSRKARLHLASEWAPQPDLPILLLIDGYDILTRAFASSALLPAFEKLQELLIEGRRFGIYHCAAGQSERDFGHALTAAQSEVIALHRHYGEDETPVDERLPGFGLDSRNALVQVYMPQLGAHHGVPQADTRLAEFLDPNGWRSRLSAAAVPGVTARAGVWCSIGTQEVERTQFEVDLSATYILIVGSGKSGRSTLLADLARQVTDRLNSRVAVLQPRGLQEGGRFDSRHVVYLDSQLIRELRDRDQVPREELLHSLGLKAMPDGRLPVFVDDCYAIDGMPGGNGINNDLADLQREAFIQPVAVTAAVWIGASPLTGAMKSGVTVYMKPASSTSDMDDGLRVRGISLRHRPGMAYAPGDVIIQTEERQFIVHLQSGPDVQHA
jgi:hypothetical protein